VAAKGLEKSKSPRDMIYFPVAYNVVGLVFVSVLYAVAPEHSVETETLNNVLYLGVLITHWSVLCIMLRRLGVNGLRELVTPKKQLRGFPSLLVFASLHVLFTTYMVLALLAGRIPLWGKVDLPLAVYYIVIHPLTAGFIEELVWRGYFIEKQLAAGQTEWRANIYSAISFAFIHGVIVFDKLIVTFVWGVIAGMYYLRERNLPVLMVTHVIVDVTAFWLTLFRPI